MWLFHHWKAFNKTHRIASNTEIPQSVVTWKVYRCCFVANWSILFQWCSYRRTNGPLWQLFTKQNKTKLYSCTGSLQFIIRDYESTGFVNIDTSPLQNIGGCGIHLECHRNIGKCFYPSRNLIWFCDHLHSVDFKFINITVKWTCRKYVVTVLFLKRF